MTETEAHLVAAQRRLRWPLRLTRAGMVCERALRAFWPLVTIILAAVAALMLGWQDSLPVEVVWTGLVATLAGGVWALWRGARMLHLPTEAEALDRLDATLPGRPIAAITDVQAIGAGDAASERVWAAHVARMATRVQAARAVRPDLRLAARDPFALRYVALLAFVVALLFGSVWRVASVGGMAPGGSGAALAAGPAWEGWIEPPAYTGKPSLYLNDIDRASLEVPAGSHVTLRLYGEVGTLAVAETVSGRTGNLPPATDPSQDFEIARNGTLAIDGPGGRSWSIIATPDSAPEVRASGPLERTAGAEFRQPFTARDDHGVASGRAEIALDLPRVDRRYGLAADPEPRETLVLDLPMTITGDRTDFNEVLVADLPEHPWAGLPVTMTLVAEDDAGHAGRSEPQEIVLPARRFFDPLASAIVEQRRDLLWSRDNAQRIAAVLRAASNHPEGLFRQATAYLQLRVAIRRIEAAYRAGGMDDAMRDETAEALWNIALLIEEGDLSSALERLRRAQDQLADAIRNGATDEEIADLMQELRDAMQDYMRQLAEQADPEAQDQQAENQQAITGDQLEQMLQRLQELMEQGRTAEAQALLDQLRQMMENMQVTQGQPGQGQGQGSGQQAMQDLAETLRNQQDLSDEAFRDLQEQFGQQGQQGQQGQGGQGQSGQGERGQGQQGQGQDRSGSGSGTGTGERSGDRPGDGPGQRGDTPGLGEGSLADRQQALRDELERQRQGLPGAGTPGGDAARDALDRAGRAMDDAEESLRENDFASALDDQSQAIEALREGMRELGEEMARQQGQAGQEGDGRGDPAQQMGQRDPLGREAGQGGRLGTNEDLLQGEDVYRRARELLDEIRRRSSDQSRPDVELDYLRRLLDRF